MSEVKDWCRKPHVSNTLGNGWCVRIDGTDVFDSINQYGCKTLRTFDIVRGLSSEEEAKAYLAQWLSEQLPDYDGQRLRADTAEADRDKQRGLKMILAERVQNAEANCSVYRHHLSEALSMAEKVRDSSLGMQRKYLSDLIVYLSQNSDAALNPNPEAESQ